MFLKYFPKDVLIRKKSLTPSAVLRHTPQRCIGGSSPQDCNALQYIALYYYVAQAVIHAPRGRKGCFSGDDKTRSAGLRAVYMATPFGRQLALNS